MLTYANQLVTEEWDRHASAQDMILQEREQEERQPGEEREDDDPLLHELQPVVGQMCPSQELEQRPPRTTEKSVVRGCCPSLLAGEDVISDSR